MLILENKHSYINILADIHICAVSSQMSLSKTGDKAWERRQDIIQFQNWNCKLHWQFKDYKPVSIFSALQFLKRINKTVLYLCISDNMNADTNISVLGQDRPTTSANIYWLATWNLLRQLNQNNSCWVRVNSTVNLMTTCMLTCMWVTLCPPHVCFQHGGLVKKICSDTSVILIWSALPSLTFWQFDDQYVFEYWFVFCCCFNPNFIEWDTLTFVLVVL